MINWWDTQWGGPYWSRSHSHGLEGRLNPPRGRAPRTRTGSLSCRRVMLTGSLTIRLCWRVPWQSSPAPNRYTEPSRFGGTKGHLFVAQVIGYRNRYLKRLLEIWVQYSSPISVLVSVRNLARKYSRTITFQVSPTPCFTLQINAH
jgi:hypothetical protein